MSTNRSENSGVASPAFSSRAREFGKAALIALALAAPAAYPVWVTATAEPPRPAHEVLLAGAALPPVAMDDALVGREIFMTTCAACHKVDGTGVPNLGKSLVKSDFLASRDDAAMEAFLTKGRPADDPMNTTRIPMPPYGGRTTMSAGELRGVVAFVRGLQDPRRMPSLPEYVAAPTRDVLAELPKDMDPEEAKYIASGQKLFANSCVSCHGKDAHGMTGLGKSLVTSEFLAKLSDDDALAFIKKGRSTSDPLNTTKVDMPPKGGNPALSDDDILDILSFLRFLAKSEAQGK
ncbi:MAG: c-type cytochrome [Phycisphaerae bacterium]|nr:c-type cytochrome [Phycisphaerae bacterium]